MSDLEKFFLAVDKWLASWRKPATITPMSEPEETSQVETQVPAPQVSIPQSRFLEFCGHIKTYEGANPANNNPYDFRYYFGGYLPKYGIVKESLGGFAMFETLAIGEEYGQTCIREMILNHPEWTFLDFFTRFAPPSDNNNTELYASTIASEMGSNISSNVKDTLNI